MKIIIDIPDTMYDWLRTGFPDKEDLTKLLSIVLEGKIISNEENKDELS